METTPLFNWIREKWIEFGSWNIQRCNTVFAYCHKKATFRDLIPQKVAY
jgi:hypothetical protein